MIASLVLPLLVCIAGALIYAFAASQKLANIGLVLFAVGAYWTVYLLTGSTFSVGGRRL